IGAGGRPLGVGFFFSLGHSTIVLGLSIALAVAAGAAGHALPVLAHYGGAVGVGISGTFLWAIGLINLAVLRGVARIARSARGGHRDEAALEAQLDQRGLMSRGWGGRPRLIRGGWQGEAGGARFGLGLGRATR